MDHYICFDPDCSFTGGREEYRDHIIAVHTDGPDMDPAGNTPEETADRIIASGLRPTGGQLPSVDAMRWSPS